ncbi:hypothetical protein [Aeromicrobium sp. Leaf291]|uniref:hypothetical protein n=1 Tax=Aeromicrobium sp. Leaf291 TaxID=1736325 RepID=UPI0006FC7F56|nr:hypothetical protein [Aeromicrobium sp. Leaf291]KQP83749.1 hypothetical protein ASF35_01860 [Aeromicrobium sp. Leaf291]
MTTETPTPETTETPQPEATTFTQADVDRIVRERVKRERDKYADYDDLKAKAGEATTLEQRVADIERKANDSEARAIRAEIANAKGLTATQAKRLVGTTREELEADADELLTDIGAQKQNGNRAPREGQTPHPSGDDEVREFTRGLFKRPE